MNGFQKGIGVGLAVIWTVNTFQGFANSKETPIKTAVPAIAHVLLSTNTGDGVVMQMQVLPGQALPIRSENWYGFMQIAQNDRALNAFLYSGDTYLNSMSN